MALPFGNTQSATIQSGEAQVSVFSVGGGKGKDVTEQTITTSIEDSKHPGEPWVVTTYRLPDESFEALVMRHKSTCDAVREALK